MAMVKLAGDIVDRNGSEGGDYWKGDVCGVHIQKQPRVIYGTPSPGQLAQRRAWKRCSNFWMTHMTAAAEQLWWAWSAAHPIVNAKGEELFLTPYQTFMSINVKRVRAGLPILLFPPIVL